EARGAVVLTGGAELARPDLPGPPTARSFADAVRVLRTRQNAEGGFGLWTASVEAHEFASVYAIHLLLEAGERGERVPDDMVQKGLGALPRPRTPPAPGLRRARTRASPAALLTRPGRVTAADLPA